MDIMYHYLAFLSTIIILYNITIFIFKPSKNLPPSPPSLPIIGHFHLLKPPFHRTFHSISQHYGPVFSLRLGRQLVVVVATATAAEECFTSNDIALASRPKTLVGQHLGYNHSILLWEPYGTHWRNLRRVATLTALSQKQIHLGAPARHDEVKAAIRDLFQRSESGSQVVNLTELFSKMTTNLLMRVILGEPRETMVKTTSASIMTPCDFIPVLRWVGYKGIEKELRSVGQERDVELQSWVDEVRRRRERKDGDDTKGLVQDLLELQEAEPDYYTDEVLKGLILMDAPQNNCQILQVNELWFNSTTVIHEVIEYFKCNFNYPYMCFSEVLDQVLESWWSYFKESFTWDEVKEDLVFNDYRRTVSKRLQDMTQKLKRSRGRRAPSHWMKQEVYDQFMARNAELEAATSFTSRR